jgi:hypothetical protein
MFPCSELPLDINQQRATQLIGFWEKKGYLPLGTSSKTLSLMFKSKQNENGELEESEEIEIGEGQIDNNLLLTAAKSSYTPLPENCF